MKKLFVSMLALALTAGAFAQTENKKAPADKSAKKEWKMKGRHGGMGNMEQLNLTEAQKQQMKSLNENFRTRMQKLKQDNSLSEEAKKEKRMELMKEHRTQMEALLTPEQRSKMQEAHKNMGAAHGKGHKKMNADERKNVREKGKIKKEKSVDKLAGDLKLTPDQKARMKAMQEQLKNEAERIKNNESLAADQKKEQLKNLHQRHRAQMESLLTAEQKQMLKNKRHERKNDNQDRITK